MQLEQRGKDARAGGEDGLASVEDGSVRPYEEPDVAALGLVHDGRQCLTQRGEPLFLLLSSFHVA
jgi:hypothetical protein